MMRNDQGTTTVPRRARRTIRPAAAFATALAALLLAACGGGGGDPSQPAEAPADLDAPVTGTLRIFAYGDTVPDEILDPFREANPDLEIQVATFNSNKAAAAKLAGGFESDVVEVCTDEMEPLTARGLLQPLDEKAIGEFDDLAFSDEPDIRDEAGNVLFVPGSAGPHGLIVNTDEVDEEITSYQALFDPAYAGRAALESAPLTAIGVSALALGMDDPLNMSAEEIEEVKQYLLENRDNFRSFAESDSDLVNLFKSGEVVIADGGRGTAQDMIDDGLAVEWIAPDEGALSWVCGFAITADAENVPASYRLIDYYSSPEAQALSAEQGFVAMNPKALKELPEELLPTADPSNLDTAIPQTQPDESEIYDRAWQEVAAG